MSIHKIVVKGTGKMSLHERFTQLSFDKKAAVKPVSKNSFIGNADYSAPSFSPPRARLVPHFPPRASSPLYDRYSSAADTRRPVSSYAVASTYIPSRMSRPTVRAAAVGRSQAGSLSSVGRMPSQSASIVAAAKLKKKSIHQRLGVRPALQTWQESRLYRSASSGSLARWGSQSRLSRWGSQSYLSRWGSSGSLNSSSGYGGYRPRWGGFNRRGRGGWGGFWARRRQAENPNNDFARGGRWRFGGGGRGNRWGGRRGRGGGGGGGWRGGNKRPPPPSREELDKELDAYMAGTRGVLDKDMEEYMSAKNS